VGGGIKHNVAHLNRPIRGIGTCPHDGFADTEFGGITLIERQDLRFVLAMQTAAQATTVQVEASAAFGVLTTGQTAESAGNRTGQVALPGL